VEIKGSFLIDPQPIGTTAKYLGVCLEVLEDADRTNLWDWLADSGANMVRLLHPDKDVRLKPAAPEDYLGIESKGDFETFRAHLLADPEANVPWQRYRFDQRLPWVGVPDDGVRRITACGVAPIVPMAYTPSYYSRPLLKSYGNHIPAPDEAIDWNAAAAAYEYYLANIYRYASRNGTTHFMMLNEPDGKDKQLVQQSGVLARLARMALDDAGAKLSDRRVAAGLRLSGPACHFAWEDYWPYVEQYCDFVDFHFYDPDPDMFRRQAARMAIRARSGGKKLAFTEFNRIGGPVQPDQALFCLRPSLQFGALVMSMLSASQAGDAGCEMALAYQFQFPATHRSFKSLVYGDMNLVDWTGQDSALNSKSDDCYPTFEQLQIRMATPGYHVFKMLARCTPGAGDIDSYEVLAVGESANGFCHVHDSSIRHNVFKMLSPEKYYSLNGSGPDLRTLVVRTPEGLIITVLNPGLTAAKATGFNLELLPDKYATAVVRETSLLLRDRAVRQVTVSGPEIVVDLPPESLTQIIITKDDLAQVTELRLEEQTYTPGTAKKLGLLETTRLRALGKLDGHWIDLTDLNVNWASSAPELVNVYQGGLVQRVHETQSDVTINAQTLNGIGAAPIVVPPVSNR
jgi:hypothetical protein